MNLRQHTLMRVLDILAKQPSSAEEVYQAGIDSGKPLFLENGLSESQMLEELLLDQYVTKMPGNRYKLTQPGRDLLVSLHKFSELNLDKPSEFGIL